MIVNGKLIFYLFLFLNLVSCTTDEEIVYPNDANVSIIPRPQDVKLSEGYTYVSPNTIFFIDTSIIDLFRDWSKILNMDPDKIFLNSEAREKSDFIVGLTQTIDFGLEGYELSIDNNKLILMANTDLGIRRGLSTISQLLILNEYKGKYFLPNLRIEDHASFTHRGLLLDCSRHFFSKEVVLKYIDLLSLYKMNVLHWHLTEDQGWRIAIDKYPELTKTAAWRVEKDSSIYGGFYSKEEIKEIVAYAERKKITIIPEIELPGHSQAAISAYPHLSCKGDSVVVANDWGVFKEIYCAGNDSVFTFLEDVLLEVMELFPSTYIHIGGDEAPKSRWEECAKCQRRIREEGLSDEHELQSYFIKRIQSFLKSHGRELIGWDEILEGGLSEGAIVQSWRGMEGGIEAVKKGNKAIMSPTSHAYLDYGLASIDLEKIYSFNPLPNDLEPDEKDLIIGGECNMWTEHVPNEDVLDSKVFPRILGMSEVLWSGQSNKDYPTFLERVYDHFSILSKMGVNYGLEALPFKYKSRVDSNSITLSIEKKIRNIEVESFLANNEMLELNKELVFKEQNQFDIVSSAYRNGKRVGASLSYHIHPHKGLARNVEYIECNYSKWYTAGGMTALTDGVLGSEAFRDGHWQGFWGDDIELIIDLEMISRDVRSVSMNFYQYNNSWIFLPKEVEVLSSLDGEKWIPWGKEKPKSNPELRGKFIEQFEIENREEKLRYIKIKAMNIKKVPDWHEAAGSDAWLFMDEIIIK